jgi:membrane protein DedA with SNARE-associated domain
MHSVLGWLSQYGYPALFCLLALGIVGLPVPDETLLVFSGYLILRGRLNPWFTFTAALAGSSLGISISYIIGRTLGCRFVVRFGKYIHLTEERINRVNVWFCRIGAWLLTVGYFVPGVRHFTALVAGMSRLPYRTFAAFAYPGAVLWIATFLTIGYFVGEQWERASATVQHDLLIGAGALGAVAVVWWAVWRMRKRRQQ